MRNSSANKGPRVNNQIEANEVLLIDSKGEKKGIIPIDEAIDFAKNEGLDLVEISPKAKPPVCKVIDYGKYKYQAQKRANEAKKKQKNIDVKEIKFRPNIDTHDYQVKMKNVEKFITDGDKVKVTLRFRGREMAHQDRGATLLEKIKEESDEFAKVELLPKFEGRQMIMVLAPK
ncbi:MAG: translation initiation factor IF-3 [Pseudomonadota bacterium]|nr:translation initiation factor IF-3 [Pseudomonadota bacterium]MEC7735241.1 translation initiation factor IF-3 [Pseudomonadota bacterium]MEC9392197.1 translation initiation factor IF-3 [Pseudomonadota bacterium]MEC9458841.1 translation initiation factor IF-3 [Pseudomonadota bacterium]MEC9481200.1 translation initiation factor IF-3 [Pseudomonadota bacterium]